jgi:CheY-like chemotaxis protein
MLNETGGNLPHFEKRASTNVYDARFDWRFGPGMVGFQRRSAMNRFSGDSSKDPHKKRKATRGNPSAPDPLAVTPAAERSLQKLAKRLSITREKPHVLLVEDSAEDAELLESALEAAKIDVRLTKLNSGQDALYYLTGLASNADRKKHPLPDILLLDLNLPGVPGLEVLKKVRSVPALDGLIVFALTASHNEWDVVRANELQIDAYLVKPTTFAGMVELVRDLDYNWLQG